MAEYIKRESVLNEAQEINHWCGYEYRYENFIPVNAVLDIPIADVAPVVHGRWIEDGSLIITCSECKRGYNLIAKYTHYCPNCGALMDGGKDDG